MVVEMSLPGGDGRVGWGGRRGHWNGTVVTQSVTQIIK
jgi:hypothetical protein